MVDLLNLKKSYQGILLDLDNTLYEYEPCHLYALAMCYQFFSDNVEGIEFEKFCTLYQMGRDAVKKNNIGTAGSHSRHLYFQLMLESMFGRTRVEESLKLGDLYWSSFIEKMKIRPWALKLLRDAKEQGIKVVIVTNLDAPLQYRKLVHLGVEDFIDFLVTSEEAGAEKPDRKIFEVALDKIALRPDDVVMIGDDEERDGLGARALGIPFILCG
jgi:putative hydrolase of the HAD superfamily